MARRPTLETRSGPSWLSPSEQGLSGVGLHTLRHSAASALIAAGEHMKVVQELLGHSSYAITADIYSHVNVEQQRAAAERLGEAFQW